MLLDHSNITETYLLSSNFHLILTFLLTCTPCYFFLLILSTVCSNSLISSFPSFWSSLGWGSYIDSSYFLRLFCHISIVLYAPLNFLLLNYLLELFYTLSDLNLHWMPFSKEFYFLPLVKYLVCSQHHISASHYSLFSHHIFLAWYVSLNIKQFPFCTADRLILPHCLNYESSS